MKTFLKVLLRLTVSLLLTFILLEGGLAWLCSSGRLKIARPTYCLGNIGSRFWADSNPTFGVWHDPHSSFKHVSPDYNLTYHANAWGMRDKERNKNAEGRKRHVVLGDSFMEGWGVATDDRMSDILERTTGQEYLNFGTSGSFGPTQYLMLYTHFAKEFEHTALIISILPDNDFLDDDYDYCRTMHAGRIRPFFTGAKPDYQLAITSPQAPSAASKYLEQFLLQFTYTGNVIKHFKELSRHKQAVLPVDYAGYFDFTPAQWDRMEHVLQEFRKAAPALPILVLTIPCDTDFQRTEKVGAPPLPGKMRELCRTLGIEYLDLMPAIQSAPGGWQSCYLKTDRHWNATGNKVAAMAVLAGFSSLQSH
ncbi:MAG: hypothetical protein WCO42_11995 [bacterium]